MRQDKVYQVNMKGNEDGYIQKLKFEVNEEEALIYAAVFDYSGYAGLGLSIVSADASDDDWEARSVPSKYFSYIPPVSLTQGVYYLVISSLTKFAYEDANIVKFGLDFIYTRENVSDTETQILLNSMELCSLPGLPNNLNTPSYLHPLTG